MVETGAIIVGSISILTLIITKLKSYATTKMVVVTMDAVLWIKA